MGSSNCNTNNNNQMQMGPMSNNMRFPGNMPISAIPGLGQNLLFNLSQYTQGTMNRAPNMLMQNPISTPLNVPTGQMNMSLAAQRLMQPGMMMQPGLPMSGAGAGPTPHLNPNFFNAAQAGGLLNNLNVSNQSMNQSSSNQTQQFDAFGRPISNSFNSSSAISPKLSDSEFEDILQRNKTVSSSAINRAVQDASAGDYASAIETLVTAISLIKQSKIASDSRCKVLINSLQDTLTGIESKSYGSRKNRNRRRSFSESSSDGDRDDSNEYSNRRVLRSRSRDRHRRSRDYGRSNIQPTGSSDFFSGMGSSSSTDRYSNRYRH